MFINDYICDLYSKGTQGYAVERTQAPNKKRVVDTAAQYLPAHEATIPPQLSESRATVGLADPTGAKTSQAASQLQPPKQKDLDRQSPTPIFIRFDTPPPHFVFVTPVDKSDAIEKNSVTPTTKKLTTWQSFVMFILGCFPEKIFNWFFKINE